MALKSIVRKIQQSAKFNTCLLCNRAPRIDISEAPIVQEEIEEKLKPLEKAWAGKHLQELDQFFYENPSIIQYKHVLPSKIIRSKAYGNPDHIYLISPDIAQDIAKHVFQRLQGRNLIVAESNPGLGLISHSLIKLGIPSVRLYEINTEFNAYLQEAFKSKPIKLFKKDLFSLWKYSNIDSLDQGRRVADMLEGVPRKSWTDEPVITVVGTLTKNTFLKYLAKSIVLQRDLATYGRVDLFLITYEKHVNTFLDTSKVFGGIKKAWATIINLFFEAELITKYPRQFFLPWETARTKKRIFKNSDDAHMYFIKVSMKKDFDLHADHFVPLFCFIMNLYAKGNLSIVATCEKWVPGCGEYLLVPRLTHTSYFEDIDVFTQFKDLNAQQILGIYREMQAHPNYPNSPFMDMIEQEWLKTETIDTDLNDSHTKSEVPLILR